MMNRTTLIIALAFISCFSYSQVFKAKVVDELSNEPLSGVSIICMHDSILYSSTATDVYGNFQIAATQGQCILKLSFVGYESILLTVVAEAKKSKDLGLIKMLTKAMDLNEVSIIAAIADPSESPLSVSNISARQIEKELGGQEVPQLMKMVPGVYASRQGGGSGDARISLRGFQQENIAILLNGVPVSSMENGLVYWSNWLGLADAAATLQVQKGLGASNIAANSVGGTVNIITNPSAMNPGGFLKHSFTSYATKKTSLSLNTGRNEKGFAVSFLGSRTSGPGYVDATYVDAWSWFLTMSNDLNNNHRLVFTALGSPEHHGQNTYLMSVEEYERYGNTFNYNWGSQNGEINNLTENFYHKPYFSLTHYWNAGKKSKLATSAYYTNGYGGGKWSENYHSPSIYSFRTSSNQIDWEAVYADNTFHQDSVYLNGNWMKNYSKHVQTHFRANHFWYGIISTINQFINDECSFEGGLHYRHFKSSLYEEIEDLLGGQYWIEDYAWAIDGVAGRNQIKTVGDIISLDNGAIMNYASAFGELSYETSLLKAFLAFNTSATTYQRYDNYNYVYSDTRSGLVSKAGFSLKGGARLAINEYQGIYLNAGHFSKEPYYKFVFSNYTNTPANDLKNEKVSSLELGYRYASSRLSASMNAYYTYWADKSLLSNEYIQFSDSSMSRAMINGLDALHIGLEATLSYTFSSAISAGALLSLGDWKWENDVNAYLYDDNNTFLDSTTVYADGLYVGDAPQTQLGLFIDIRPFRNCDVKINALYFDRLYANFDPANRNDPMDKEQPWRLPSYTLVDVHLGYTCRIAGLDAEFRADCFNLLDDIHVLRGEDGSGHDKDSFRGYWSYGRNFNFSARIAF